MSELSIGARVRVTQGYYKDRLGVVSKIDMGFNQWWYQVKLDGLANRVRPDGIWFTADFLEMK